MTDQGVAVLLSAMEEILARGWEMGIKKSNDPDLIGWYMELAHKVRDHAAQARQRVKVSDGVA